MSKNPGNTDKIRMRTEYIVCDVGQSVVIGDPAKPMGSVKVQKTSGGRTRIAFDFPSEIDIHRREVADKIMGIRQQEQSPENNPDKGPYQVQVQKRPYGGQR